jgi:hypothetical protein
MSWQLMNVFRGAPTNELDNDMEKGTLVDDRFAQKHDN